MSSLSGRPGHLIRRLHQISTRLFLQRVAEAGHDLTPVQYAALCAIADSPGMDQAGVAAIIAKDRATTGSVIDRLEQKGLITRGENSRDRRARVLHLTEAGAVLLETLLPVVDAVQREILAGLDEAEQVRFVELARKAIAAAGEEEDRRDATGAILPKGG